jgi:cysteinyl-tRNA synthetase
MARASLGDSIDIHGGGLDLLFPHHENEIAQSECGTGHAFARYWMHNGMLVVGDGRKMGKSEGNAFNIVDVVAQYPPEALRLYYLQTHYRSPLPWNAESLDESLGMLSRLYDARQVASQMGGKEEVDRLVESLGPDAARVVELSNNFRANFMAALKEDFNTAQALGYTFELARAINRFSNHKKAKKRGGPIVAHALVELELLGSCLGLLCDTAEDFADEVKAKRLPSLGLTPADVDALLAARAEARQNKDWAEADNLRDKLEASRIVVMDRADGVDWKIRL